MLSKTIALALLTVLLGASASTSTNARTATITSIGHSLAVCDDGGSPVQGCSGRRCVSVQPWTEPWAEPWAGARTAGPTFPMPCRPIASLAPNPIA
jgi:hypothetical protein